MLLANGADDVVEVLVPPKTGVCGRGPKPTACLVMKGLGLKLGFEDELLNDGERNSGWLDELGPAAGSIAEPKPGKGESCFFSAESPAIDE